MLFIISSLVSIAVLVQVAVVVWGWANGTMHESPQEKVNAQFEEIVRRVLVEPTS